MPVWLKTPLSVKYRRLTPKKNFRHKFSNFTREASVELKTYLLKNGRTVKNSKCCYHCSYIFLVFRNTLGTEPKLPDVQLLFQIY